MNKFAELWKRWIEDRGGCECDLDQFCRIIGLGFSRTDLYEFEIVPAEFFGPVNSELAVQRILGDRYERK